jgi:hypothetical protein
VSKKKAAKKKTAKKARAASAPRRKAATSRATGRRTALSAPASRKIQLKPIHVLIERAMADLRVLPQTEATDITLRQLEAASMAMGDICDPDTPGGCGPTMEFPLNA